MTFRNKEGSAFSLLLVALFLTLLVFAPATAQSQAARMAVDFSISGVTVTADLGDTELISIDVAAPDGEIWHMESKASPATFTPELDAPDGSYRYEVQLVDGETGQMLERASGIFNIQAGQIVTPGKGIGTDGVEQGFLHKVGQVVGRLANHMFELLAKDADAADVIASGTAPSVIWDDTDAGADYRIFQNHQGSFGSIWRLFKGGGTVIFDIWANESTYTTNLSDSLRIDTLGDFHFAGDRMFFDRSATRLGIGTTVPITTVDAIGNRITLRPSTAVGAKEINMRVDGSANDINSYNADLFIRTDFTANNTYLLQNRLGIGTTAPAANTHVFGTTFPTLKTTRQVTFTGGGRGVAAYELKSTGNMGDGFGPSFEFWISDDTYTASLAVASMEAVREGADNSGKWIVRTANGGVLGARLIANHLGQIGIGREPRAGTLIDTSNNAYLSTGGSWVSSSSRKGKDNIRDLATEKAVRTLEGLNPVTFTYKAAPEEHHVGFIAEDVPDIVATPERTGLSALDITAVLTKVVQEQQKTIQKQDETIKRLSERMATLERDMKLRGAVASLTDSP